MPALIASVQAAGDAIGLPYVAAQADLGDPEPMSDEDGRPYAETSFHWVDPSYAYWRDRKLALQLAFLTAAPAPGARRISSTRSIAPKPAARPISARRSLRPCTCRAGLSAQSSGARASPSVLRPFFPSMPGICTIWRSN